jgi:cytochrome d ubiquinol oxidase subunit II
MLANAWYLVLLSLFAGYFVLGGLDYGVGLLLCGEPDPAQRRRALTAIGPFFLPNEVWLVVALGVLFGAFPMIEGELISGYYPATATALLGVVLVTVAVQLRSRPAGPRARARWDTAIIAGGTLAALGWGAFVGAVVQGHDVGRDAVGQLLTPFAAATALTMAALVALHGATFLGLRLPADRAPRWSTLAARLTPVALTAIGVAAVMGLLSGRVRAHGSAAVLVLLVALVAAVVVAGRLASRRPGWSFVASAAAAALPVFIMAASSWPNVLVGGVTVADAAAAPGTLRLLTWVAVPAFPVLIGFQTMCWWVFRGRIDGRAPVYW